MPALPLAAYRSLALTRDFVPLVAVVVVVVHAVVVVPVVVVHAVVVVVHAVVVAGDSHCFLLLRLAPVAAPARNVRRLGFYPGRPFDHSVPRDDFKEVVTCASFALNNQKIEMS